MQTIGKTDMRESVLIPAVRYSYRGKDMKLEMELLRDLLLYVEEKADRPHSHLENIQIDGWSADQIAYHVVLASQDNLMTATVNIDTDDDDVTHVNYTVHRLTMRGHDLLGSVRESRNWIAIKDGARKVGAATASAVFDFATGYIKQQIARELGMPMP